MPEAELENWKAVIFVYVGHGRLRICFPSEKVLRTNATRLKAEIVMEKQRTMMCDEWDFQFLSK